MRSRIVRGIGRRLEKTGTAALSSVLARIPVTITHHYDFGAERERVGADLVNPRSWDAIRETAGPFGLPRTRIDWERGAAAGDFTQRAAAVAAIADQIGAHRLCSYGVGAAFLELELARLRSDIELVCTDFAPQTVDRLRELFPEAEVRRHDLSADAPIAADLSVFHRIDSELSNRQWQAIFPRFDGPILLVATQLLDWNGLLHERRLRSSPTATNAGYVRSQAGLRSLWRATHREQKVAIGALAGYFLTPRSAEKALLA